MSTKIQHNPDGVYDLHFILEEDSSKITTIPKVSKIKTDHNSISSEEYFYHKTENALIPADLLTDEELLEVHTNPDCAIRRIAYLNYKGEPPRQINIHFNVFALRIKEAKSRPKRSEFQNSIDDLKRLKPIHWLMGSLIGITCFGAIQMMKYGFGYIF